MEARAYNRRPAPKHADGQDAAPRTGIHVHVPRDSAALRQPTAVQGTLTLWAAVEQHARELGFIRVGHCTPEPFVESRRALQEWLAKGHQGEMHYLVEDGGRCDPRALLPDARSMLVVALPHPTVSPAAGATAPSHERRSSLPADARNSVTFSAATGEIARYARGPDYHRVIRDKLHELANFIAAELGVTVRSRICVDTAPILEREAARRAAMAFIGKNTLAIIPGIGSTFLLGVMLLDVDLQPAEPAASEPVASTASAVTSTRARPTAAPAALADSCGSCTACLDACPTQAFVAPHQLDARRCISYLTIELKGAIDRDLRPQLGNHVFGCDRCQDVCPYNKAAKARVLGKDLPAIERLQAPSLASWLGMTATDYRRLVKGTALKRTTRQRFQRNAAVALGNANDPAALPQLIAHLHGNHSALVRQHCAWALGRLGGPAAIEALERAMLDPDPDVTAEAHQSLQELQAKT